MAERDSITPDSIRSLIYVEKMGNPGGYITDLLKEETHENMKSFIFCSKCGGISRRPQIHDGQTFCTDCTGIGGKIDGRVDEFVRKLQCRCPLSSRGCDWSGKLGSIENHINGCDKVNLECQRGCGKVFQKCDTNDHENECPFRFQECEYCRLEVQASKANEHIKLCQEHPDGEVICPYKEVGCDTIGIVRKNLDAYLTQKVNDHQRLLLRELHQLRTENEQLRDKMEKKEFETTDKLKYLKRRDTNRSRSICMLLALVVMCVAILLPLLQLERDKIRLNELSIKSNKQTIQSNEQSIQSNEQSIQSNIQSIQSNEQSIQSNEQSIQSNIQSIQSNKQSIQSNEQSIQSNEQSIQSNEQSIQSNEQSIQSNEQSIQSIQSNEQSIQSNIQSIRYLILMATAKYITDYIADRDKTLEGIEWTYEYVKDQTLYGPIFYLGKCKLRIRCYVWTLSSEEFGVNYYIKRLKGDYDDVIDTCIITYIHLYNLDLEDNRKFNIMNMNREVQLKTGDDYYFYIKLYNQMNTPTTMRIYFEIK